jgi:transcriptional regulator with XRE-family HTH domain
MNVKGYRGYLSRKSLEQTMSTIIDNRNSFAKKLRKLRVDNNLSLENLGYKLDLSKQALSKLERMQASPSIETLIKLADLFDLTIDELVGRDKEKQSDNTSA